MKRERAPGDAKSALTPLLSMNVHVQLLLTIIINHTFMHRRGKGIGRNFSRGGLPAIFQIQGGGSTPIFDRFYGQNERIFGPGGAWLSPAYACLRLCSGVKVQCMIVHRRTVVWPGPGRCNHATVIGIE